MTYVMPSITVCSQFLMNSIIEVWREKILPTFQANVNAIRLLKELESAGQQASPEQQEILSRYVGWGGLSDAFDPEKPAWVSEYAQLKELLTPEEYLR